MNMQFLIKQMAKTQTSLIRAFVVCINNVWTLGNLQPLNEGSC